LQDLTTVDGTSIWAGDGVHLTSNATRVAAMQLMASIVGGGETTEPANKRARLESVIPVKTNPLPAAKAAQPAPPPHRPVPPPLWLSGQLLTTQRGNLHSRGQQRGGRGSQSSRGGQPGPVRTAPPRGGNRGGPEAAVQAAEAAGESPPR
jgi:hypothetical protein